jgi:hypothetical protein
MASFASILKRVETQLHGPLKDNIFFVHIPKCGGASISYAINWSYRTLDIRQDRNFISLDPAASFDIATKMTNQVSGNSHDLDDYPVLKLRESLLLYFMSQENTRYISGHFTFSDLAYREFHSRYAFITILRDPVKRWISAYFYNRYKQIEHRKVESDIQSYLASPFGQTQGYELVKFVGGPDEKGDYTSPQAIQRAKDNLHKFDVLGFLEHQAAFLRDFEARFGLKLKLEHRNQNPKSAEFRQSVITPEMEKQIQELCRPDLELYHYAAERVLKAD